MLAICAHLYDVVRHFLQAPGESLRINLLLPVQWLLATYELSGGGNTMSCLAVMPK